MFTNFWSYSFGHLNRPQTILNKTGLQPLSRPVEQVHYFGGWVEGAKSLCAKTLQADRSGGARCIIVGTYQDENDSY